MDLPHTPTSPQKLYECVTSEATDLWHYILKQNIPGMKVEIKWKKQFYGAWCTVRWFPKSYCRCKEEDCDNGKYILKETTMFVKSDFGLEVLKRFMIAEKSWINNFSTTEVEEDTVPVRKM